MKMMMRTKINTGAIAIGVAGVILAGAVAADTKQQSASSAAVQPRPEHPAGCYLIWGNRNLLKTCDFLKGGQIMVQWRDIAPARGKFDWSKLDEGIRFFAKIGWPFTVQVNANKKPDWLWDYVAKCGYRGREPIPQYWDPRYLVIQKELITAFANHLKASPHMHLILCVRASYNAIGTEHAFVRIADRSPSDRWTYPPDGHRYPVPWTHEERNKYCYAVMRAYMDAFMPEIPVALRANLFTAFYPDGSAQHLIDEGGWVFGTGSDIEHQSKYHKTFEDMALFCVRVARSGKTKAYWENWGSVETHTNGVSWNYWRCLMELHKGVSYVAVKGWAVRAAQKNPEYRAAFEFVNRYAGFHAAPAESPGAWCALRGGEHEPRGNYWWFLEQIDPDGTSVAVESDRGQKMIGPDDQCFGRFARRTDVASGKRQLFFRLDPKFRASLREQPCRLRVWYLDDGQGAWQVRWGTGPTDQRTVQKSGSGRWKEYVVELPGSAFRGILERKSDLVLVAMGENDTTFHMVEIVRGAR
jgi:hypothetical protein